MRRITAPYNQPVRQKPIRHRPQRGNPLGPHHYVPLGSKMPVFITIELHKKLMEQQKDSRA